MGGARPRRLAAAALLAAGLGAGALLLADALAPPRLERYRDTSVQVVDRRGELLRAFTAGDGVWRLPARPADVDPLFLAMLKAVEDRRFDRHPGVDPLAVLRAGGQALGAGRVVSGASTLSMQAARLLEPRPRTLGAKLHQAARALQLEWRLGKAEVLAVYLTLAPYGGNLEGVRAASLAWFGKEPRHLLPAEAALLVALPQAPGRLDPSRDAAAARAARDRVLDRAAAAGLLDAAAIQAAKAEPVPTARRPLPLLAPHLAERMARERPGERVIATTLDAAAQRRLEALVRREVGRFEPQASIAALAVDTVSRRVVAAVGGADYFAAGRQGMVDLTRAVRSPGSALKPFIYGLAFDRLIAHPETVVDDVPTRFGLWEPENFSGAHAGEVTARHALQRSLNVPAVVLLDRLGPQRFDRALAEAGVAMRLDRSQERIGLAVALGGVGVTLEEMVTLYAGLADGGTVRPLRRGPDAPAGEGRRLLGPAAAWQVADVLRGAPRPPGFAAAEDGGGRGIAFKTGTSYGYRDAWALGFDGRHTVGVWVGRADGTPCPACVGLHAAAPVLFRAFDLLPREGGLRLPEPPPGVLVASTAALPPALQRLGATPSAQIAGPKARRALSITFPVDDTEVWLQRDGDAFATLPLEARGGQRPLRWFVNGRPLAAAAWRDRTEWRPDGPGFATVTAIDAAGNVAHAAVRLTEAE
ncbi:MAG TPA: penicillin-binding protein 1C [Alphaproteobacteria bacterium]|nr:penicillin-binding protein 1C [Alphaproteobacteria bacterium]